jgi:hypothetical protein
MTMLPQDKIQAKADRARKLTISFLNKQGLNPWPPGKIKSLLCLPLSGPKKKQELAAVERLLCGIEWLEDAGWVRPITRPSDRKPLTCHGRSLYSNTSVWRHPSPFQIIKPCQKNVIMTGTG